MEGAACWRADGTPIALGGGLARPGVRFRPEAARHYPDFRNSTSVLEILRPRDAD
jgi:hypothetical protein